MTEFYNKSKYKQRRKDLRNNPTKTEKLLWDILKGKKLEGYKFRRQYGVGRYVIDFYCVKKKLALEIDGDVHDNEESKVYDKEREEFISNFGIGTLRIKNEKVERNIEEVVEMILKELKK
ncbi:MAG: DUF559 domain-containing protein [Bacteroidota bacterium]|nr:DUF559 domain-containing protein [Bacteroidota bacterium]